MSRHEKTTERYPKKLRSSEVDEGRRTPTCAGNPRYSSTTQRSNMKKHANEEKATDPRYHHRDEQKYRRQEHGVSNATSSCQDFFVHEQELSRQLAFGGRTNRSDKKCPVHCLRTWSCHLATQDDALDGSASRVLWTVVVPTDVVASHDACPMATFRTSAKHRAQITHHTLTLRTSPPIRGLCPDNMRCFGKSRCMPCGKDTARKLHTTHSPCVLLHPFAGCAPTT